MAGWRDKLINVGLAIGVLTTNTADVADAYQDKAANTIDNQNRNPVELVASNQNEPERDWKSWQPQNQEEYKQWTALRDASQDAENQAYFDSLNTKPKTQESAEGKGADQIEYNETLLEKRELQNAKALEVQAANASLNAGKQFAKPGEKDSWIAKLSGGKNQKDYVSMFNSQFKPRTVKAANAIMPTNGKLRKAAASHAEGAKRVEGAKETAKA